MQKLLAKYGLAAHLALLAAAPLLLFPFCADSVIASVLLWLSIPAGLWTLLEPSMRGFEHLHDARKRVLREIIRDPVFWVSLALVIYTGIRSVNTGIAVAYDAEVSSWHLTEAQFPFLPGVVGEGGVLPFAAAVSLVVLLQGCRHSLGRSARMAFLLLSSSLSGFGAVLALLAIRHGHSGALAFLLSVGRFECSFVGFAFGLYLFAGVVSLVAIFQNRWYLSLALLILSVGGNGAGLLAFAPPYIVIAVLAAVLVMVAYASAYSFILANVSTGSKILVLSCTALVIGGLIVAMSVSSSVLSARLDAYVGFELLPSRFWESRELLSGVASETWKAHLWNGTGLGSFPLDFRFGATNEGWALFPRGVQLMPNGWWLALVERGIVGLVFFALPLVFLVVTYFCRLGGWVRELFLPHPACLMLPLVLALFVGVGFFDCSPLRAEACVALATLLAVSAAAFPRMKRKENGR